MLQGQWSHWQAISKKLVILKQSISVSLDNLKIDKRAKYLIKDLTQNCTDILNGIDMVFHVAGIKGSYEITKKLPASFMQPMLCLIQSS